MHGLPLVALFLCITAGELDLTGLATLETRGGEGPLFAGQPTRPGVVGVLTPSAELRYLGPRLDLRLDTGLRAFWREPNLLGLKRPLLLSVTNLVAEARVTRQLTLTTAVAASAGEPDYAALAQILGTNQATIPQGVSKVLSVVAGVRGDYKATRTLRFSGGVEFTRRQPLGDDIATIPGVSQFVFPRQTSVAVSPVVTAKLSRRDDLILSSPASYGTYSTGTDIATVAPSLGWRTYLSRDVDLRLAVGVAFADVLRVPTTPATPGITYIPRTGTSKSAVSAVEVNVRVLAESRFSLHSVSVAQVDPFVDPVLGVAIPRGTLSTGFSLILVPNWMFGVKGGFSTSLAARGQPFSPPPDETLAFATLQARHRLSDLVEGEIGVRYSDSAPHFSNGVFAFHQRQLWFYVSVTAATKRAHGSFPSSPR